MEHIRTTVLSPDMMQSTIEQLYATFALPLPHETCRGQLADVMPEFVAQMPVLEFDSHSQPSAFRRWDPTNYVVHVRPAPTGKPAYVLDESSDLRVKATYRRKPESTDGPEFVEITCSFNVGFVSSHDLEPMLRLQVLCELQPLQYVKLPMPVRDRQAHCSFDYVLAPRSLINLKHELRLAKNDISPKMSAVRQARVAEINESQHLFRENCLLQFQWMQQKGFFKRSEASSSSVSDAFLARVDKDCAETDWIQVSHDEQPGIKARHHVTIFRDDDNGGLIQIKSVEVSHLFREANEYELRTRFLRTQR